MDNRSPCSINAFYAFNIFNTLYSTHKSRAISAYGEFQRYIDILGTIVFGDLKLPLIMMQEIVSGQEYLQEEIIRKFMNLFAPVIRIITRGQKAGGLRKKPPLLVHFMAVAGIYFFTAGRDFLAKHRSITESGLPTALLKDREVLLREIGDILFHGLAG
jgi:hypothetical protein